MADFEPKERLQTLQSWLGCLVSKAETARWNIAKQQAKAGGRLDAVSDEATLAELGILSAVP